MTAEAGEAVFPARVKVGLAIAIALLGLLQVARYLLYPGRRDALPAVYSVQPFALTDASGSRFGTEQLNGHVWIASYVFTSCRDVCPMISARVSNLQRRLAGTDVKFVSFSVDPEVDTPARLSVYAREYEADPARWHFLTGTRAEVSRVVTDILHQPMIPSTRDDAGYDIVHDQRLTLVDATGLVRGLYPTDAEGLDRIERDARALAH